MRLLVILVVISNYTFFKLNSKQIYVIFSLYYLEFLIIHLKGIFVTPTNPHTHIPPHTLPHPSFPLYIIFRHLEAQIQTSFETQKETDTSKLKREIMRTSNHLIGLLNFLTFLLSIPILAGGIWLSTRANNSDCMSFLQWPIIVIGVSIMVVSLAGFAGACYRNTFLMYLYLWAMFVIIAVLIGFIIFAYAVTDKGSGRPVMNRVYPDYYLQDYSGWLKDRVASDSYWGKIRSCIHDSKACAKTGRIIGGYPETADMYYLRKLNPIQVSVFFK